MSRHEATSAAAFGQLLRRCRRASGLSQEELAERASVGVRTICDLERGQRRTRPYRQTVGSLAEALGLQGPQLDEFVRLSGQPGVGPHALHDEILDDHALSPAQAPDAPEKAGVGAWEMALPRELPAAVPGFTGRDAELAALDALLDTAHSGSPLTMLIAAIGGTAGVGKTALAVHWAHRVAGLFPDGQLYVNLRGYDPGQPLPTGEALARFLRALGVAGQDIPAELDERAARYRSLLAARRMLIVLDNARDADQVRLLLPGSPACAVVMTSRDALAGLVARDGAHRLDLDLLPLADAVGLLRALIGGRVDAAPEAAAELASLCCRLPLALRVAAELAAARPGISLASLAAELADQQQRLDLLDAAGDQGTAVRAVFSWSLRHLDPATARAFSLLGCHLGPDLDVYAAAALTGTGLSGALHLLDQLVRAHLIQKTWPSRYTMHDLLRDYAREAAADEGDDEQRVALTRLLDYYLHAAAAAMDALYPAEQHQRPRLTPATAIAPRLTKPDTARAWLDAELACLAAVVAHAAAGGWPAHAIQLAATLFRYLDSGGHPSYAVTVHGHARIAAQQTGDVGAEATALHSLGAAELRQRHDQRAEDHLQQALALRRQTGDRRGEAATLGNLGVLAWWQGSYQMAAGHYEQALKLARETGDRACEGTSLCNLAAARVRLGQSEQAASHLDQALNLARDTGDQATETYVLMNLCDISLRQGRYEQAAPYLQQGLALARDTGDRVSEAAMLSDLGELDLRHGRYEQAAHELRTALALARDVGARSTEIDALNLLGEVSLAAGDHAQARIHYDAALSLASQAGDTSLQARAHDGLARAYHAGRELDQARRHWQQALTIYAEMGGPEADQVRAQLAAAQQQQRHQLARHVRAGNSG